MIEAFRSGVFRAAPVASEAVPLRGELVAAHITIFDRDNQIVVLKEQVASERAEKYKARLAQYEGPNAPSSTKSQFDHRRNKYRKKHGARGSDVSGSDRPVRPDGKGRRRPISRVKWFSKQRSGVRSSIDFPETPGLPSGARERAPGPSAMSGQRRAITVARSPAREKAPATWDRRRSGSSTGSRFVALRGVKMLCQLVERLAVYVLPDLDEPARPDVLVKAAPGLYDLVAPHPRLDVLYDLVARHAGLARKGVLKAELQCQIQYRCTQGSGLACLRAGTRIRLKRHALATPRDVINVTFRVLNDLLRARGVAPSCSDSGQCTYALGINRGV